MAIQEVLILLKKNSKISQINDKLEYFAVDFFEASYTAGGLKYLFDCYDRVEEEKRQYPKVKIIFSLIICINLLTTFIFYRGVVLLKFYQH